MQKQDKGMINKSSIPHPTSLQHREESRQTSSHLTPHTSHWTAGKVGPDYDPIIDPSILTTVPNIFIQFIDFNSSSSSVTEIQVLVYTVHPWFYCVTLPVVWLDLLQFLRFEMTNIHLSLMCPSDFVFKINTELTLPTKQGRI